MWPWLDFFDEPGAADFFFFCLPTQGKTMLIIGFGYKARRGKDTAIRSIIEARGQGQDIRRYAFADALREEIQAAAFDVWAQNERERPYDPRAAMELLCAWAGVAYDTNAPADEQNPHGKQRALQQWWGTEYRRTQDADYWLKRIGERIDAEAPEVALISDMRFRNELDFIRRRGGYVVRVEREGFEAAAPVAQHISEWELDQLKASEWDATLWALDGDIEELKASAVEIFDGICGQAMRGKHPAFA